MGPLERRYFAILSLLHALTALAWFDYKDVVAILSSPDAICWPFWAGCESVRAITSASFVRGAVLTYLGLGLAGAWVLHRAASPRPGLVTFVVASVLGTALYVLDYRLRFNPTTMFAWVAVTVLVVREKKLEAVQLLLALFYFWAGTLKLNPEWLSGRALYGKPLFVPYTWMPAASAYVVVLELVLVWGLFARSARVRWAVYAQLMVFHVVSFGVVRWFYPLLMVGLTSVFPLVWRRAPERALTIDIVRGPASAWWKLLVPAAIFSAFQLVPYAYPGDPAITGEGRVFALHMFDARVSCVGDAWIREASGARKRAPLTEGEGEPRVRCDPLVLLGNARKICRDYARRGESPPRVDVRVDARRSTGARMRPLLRLDDLCSNPPEVSLLRHNAWILTGE